MAIRTFGGAGTGLMHNPSGAVSRMLDTWQQQQRPMPPIAREMLARGAFLLAGEIGQQRFHAFLEELAQQLAREIENSGPTVRAPNLDWWQERIR